MASSIGYLLDETDHNLTQGVLFEVKLELSEPDVIFVPPLDKSICNNFYDKMLDYISYIFNGCSLIPRIAKHLDKECRYVRLFPKEGFFSPVKSRLNPTRMKLNFVNISIKYYLHTIYYIGTTPMENLITWKL